MGLLLRGQEQSLDMEVEAGSEQRKMSQRTKGGFITMPFIIGTLFFPFWVQMGLFVLS